MSKLKNFIKDYQPIICMVLFLIGIIILSASIIQAASIIAQKIYDGLITLPHGFSFLVPSSF